MAAGHSIFDDVQAPAPRYLMRLALLEQLINSLPTRIDQFLEIGPGLGDVSIYLSRRFRGSRGLMIDFSERCVALLRDRIASQPSLEALVGDFSALRHECTYDLIVACEVFEHLEDDAAAFRGVARLLKPGGRFLFSVPAHQRKWQRADIYAGHYRRYDKRELCEHFASNGLDVEVLWSYGFPVTMLLYPFWQVYYRYKTNALHTKTEASKLSGVERGLAKKLARWFPMAVALRPFFFCQERVKNTEIGDGFLVLARKPLGSASHNV